MYKKSGTMCLLLLLGAFLLPACKSAGNDESGVTEPQVILKVIEDRSELISGPNALGDLGDFLLQNDKIRVIVQQLGFSRGMVGYGGGIIDADIIRADGSGYDNFGEMLPIFLFMGMRPTVMEIIDDGAESGRAHLRVQGVGADIIALVSQYLPWIMDPEQVLLQVDYYLDRGKPYVEIETSIINTKDYPLNITLDDKIDMAMGLLKSAMGVDLSGKINLQVPMPAGDVWLFGAGNDVFVPGITGYDIQYTLEKQLYFEPLQLPALPGVAADFMATSGPGVSYGVFMKPHERNYVAMNRDYYKNATDHSMEIPMLMSGLTGAFHTWMPETIAPHESFSMTKYFAVSDGDVGSIRDIYHEYFNDTVGTLGGQVIVASSGEPLAGASVVVFDADNQPFSQYFTDGEGKFSGLVPPGKYYMRVVAEDRPSTPAEDAVPITVMAGAESVETIAVSDGGQLAVTVTDENGKPLPAKIIVMGQIAADQAAVDPMDFLYDYSINEKRRPNDLSWYFNDGYGNHEYVEKLFNTASGTLDVNVRPGKYTLVVSRGPEYSQERQEIEISAGQLTSAQVSLKRVIDTGHYAAGDVHIHSVHSLDSYTLLPDRVAAIAAEGMDFAIATDHNYITDYSETVADLKVTDWVKPVVGMEYTHLEMGHFNGYPLNYDLTKPTKGASPWVAPPAESASAEEVAKYNALPEYLRKPNRPAGYSQPTGFEWFYLTPKELMDELRSYGKYGPSETIVVVNHPRDSFMGYFNAFNLDTNTGMPRPAPNPLLARSETILAGDGINNGQYKCENFSFDFDAIEVLNSQRMDLLHGAKMALDATSDEYAHLPEGNGPGKYLVESNGQRAYPGGVDDWFNLLNHGYRYAVVGASDSHQILEDRVGLNRTYMQVGNKAATTFDERELVKAIKERRTIVSNGPFITLALDSDQNGNGGDDEIAYIGDELKDDNGQVLARITLQSAHWIKVDRILLWVNGEVVKEWTKADGLPGILADGRYSQEFAYALSLDKDSWVVAEAYGDDEGRNSLWPVYIYNENPFTNIANVANELAATLGLSLNKWGRFKPDAIQRTYPYALTSPIWVDVGGDGFTAPEPEIAKCLSWSKK